MVSRSLSKYPKSYLDGQTKLQRAKSSSSNSNTPKDCSCSVSPTANSLSNKDISKFKGKTSFIPQSEGHLDPYT